MESIALVLILFSVLVLGYAYAGYPLLLKALDLFTGGADARADDARGDPSPWPTVSLTVPVFNEADQMEEVLEHLLAIDYPRDRLQIVIVSDASTDGTDEIVRRFTDRGVSLHRLPTRQGKTAAENTVAPLLEGEIVVNTDASIRIHPDAVKALVRRLQEPGVGLASGRDISISPGERSEGAGESGYVGYEMWVRQLETRTSGIVGASGCLYAIRAELHRYRLPGDLSRDFAAALVAHEHGFRAVSADEATCLVPRTGCLRREYRRKVRTMTRGMRTLHFKRPLLNPLRHGVFAWKLLSHKVCRWAVPWTLAGGAVGIALLAPTHPLARAALLGIGSLVAVSAIGWMWPSGRSIPTAVSLPAHVVWSNIAAIHATLRVPLSGGSAVWEPTRRGTGEPSGTAG